MSPAMPSRPFLKQLSAIALPMSLQMLMFTSVVLVDAVMLGQLGERELGAAGLSDRAVFLFLLIQFGASNAGQVLAAQYWGAQDAKGLRRVIALTMVVTTLVGAFSMLLFFSASRWIIGLSSRDPEVIVLGGRYLSIVGVSMLGAGILLPLDSALRTVGRASVPTRFGVVETLLNIGLNYCLIFGNLGFPALGMEGAAWGTLIARSVRLLLMIGHVRLFEPDVACGVRDFLDSLNRAQLVRFGKLAAPLVLNHFLWAGGVFTLQLIFARLGVAALAVSTVLSTLQRFVTAVTIAVAVATSILVGRAIGANQPDIAVGTAFRSVRVAIGLGLVLAVGLLLLREPLLGLFGGLEGSTLTLARAAFLVLGVEVVLRSITVVVIVGGLKAGGDVAFCLGLDFFCAWIVAIPLAALAAFHWRLGFIAVYVLAQSEESSKLVMGLWRLWQGRWMKKLIDEPAAPPFVEQAALATAADPLVDSAQ